MYKKYVALIILLLSTLSFSSNENKVIFSTDTLREWEDSIHLDIESISEENILIDSITYEVDTTYSESVYFRLCRSFNFCIEYVATSYSVNRFPITIEDYMPFELQAMSFIEFSALEMNFDYPFIPASGGSVAKGGSVAGDTLSVNLYFHISGIVDTLTLMGLGVMYTPVLPLRDQSIKRFEPDYKSYDSMGRGIIKTKGPASVLIQNSKKVLMLK